MDVLGILCVPNWLIGITIFLAGFYFYKSWHFGYFKARGISGPTPQAGFGTVLPFIKKGYHRYQIELVQEYGKLFGMFTGRDPEYVISDVKMLKQILVKDFGYFENRRPFFLRGPVADFVFDTRDHDWRRIRRLLTPTFTSGKLRQMDTTINSIADQLVENMDEAAGDNSIIEAKSVVGSYVMDVIAAVAFGLKTNSQKNAKDPFVKAARQAFDVPLSSPLILIIFLIPEITPILEYFKFCMFPAASIKFFRKVVDSALAIRKDKSHKGNVDFLKLMIDAHEMENDQETVTDLKESGLAAHKPLKGLTDAEIFGQCYGFFLAGYDTTSTTLSFLLYNLALDQAAQEKARQEVLEILTQHPTPTYDSVQKMPYLEMCISETLRMFPPLPMIDRTTANDITIEGLRIEKGTVVNIPIYAIHHNAEIWPDPYKFDPTRFTSEAKEARDTMHYLPFGFGPRLCIGMRLAQMEMRITMIRLLKQFRFLPCKETQIPIKLKPGFFTVAESGIKLKVERL